MSSVQTEHRVYFIGANKKTYNFTQVNSSDRLFASQHRSERAMP